MSGAAVAAFTPKSFMMGQIWPLPLSPYLLLFRLLWDSTETKKEKPWGSTDLLSNDFSGYLIAPVLCVVLTQECRAQTLEQQVK